MKKIGFLSIVGFILLFLVSLSFGFGNINLTNSQNSAQKSLQSSSSKFTANSSSNKSILERDSQIPLTFDKLEIAKTSQEQQKGMMFRTSLCEKCGMIFEFTDEDYRSFWMKNTLIDLDIIFIDKDGKIINVQNAKAEGKADKNPKGYLDYQTYPSTDKAKYVLEVNSGFAKRMNLESGKFLEMEKLLAQTVPFDNSFDQK